MTFHPTMRKLVEGVRPKLPVRARVLDLGNQRFTAGNDFPSTKAFYESLDCSYLALDVNTKMGAIICDLNVVGHDIEPADLVADCGTAEHIFDHRAVFENVHNFTNVGGFNIHCLPLTLWANHGYVNYNPILFRDLAHANDYDMILTAIANRWGQEIIPLGPEGFVEKHPVELEKKIKQVVSGGWDAFVISILRKTKDQAFRVPIQGKYKSDIADEDLRKLYAA